MFLLRIGKTLPSFPENIEQLLFKSCFKVIPNPLHIMPILCNTFVPEEYVGCKFCDNFLRLNPFSANAGVNIT